MSGISLDSNILLSLLKGEPKVPEISHHLNQLLPQQRLVVCGPVYAEAWKRAGVSHATCTLRRRKSGGGLPRRILTDYAHASVHNLKLFTLNVADYGDFPEVPLLTLEGLR